MSGVHAVTTFAVPNGTDMASACTDLERTLRSAAAAIPDLMSRVTANGSHLRVAVTLPGWDTANGKRAVTDLMDEVSRISGDSVTQLHTDFRPQSAIPEPAADTMGSGPYEIAARYAAGDMHRDEMVKQLGAYPYAKRNTSASEQDVPGSVDELTRAHTDNLISDRDYMEILRRISDRAIEDGPDEDGVGVDLLALSTDIGKALIQHGVSHAAIVVPFVDEDGDQGFSFIMLGRDDEQIETDVATFLRTAADFADEQTD